MNDDNRPPICILTVGDGDLTYSLALLRAYHPWITVTPTTIVSSETHLVHTYANAKENIQELYQSYHTTVLYNIDAAHLERLMPNKYDLIIFNHPHLGDAELLISKSEALHAQKHSILLAHYFYSAQFILKQPNGRIQLCLAGTQPNTWRVDEMAAIHGLTRTPTQPLSTSSPPHYIFTNHHHHHDDDDDNHIPEPSKVLSHYPCPRKYRNGTLGSKTFLAKYGYRHRRTGGDLYKGNESDMKVFNSVILLYSRQTDVGTNHGSSSWKEQQDDTSTNMMDVDIYTCTICRVSFQSHDELHNHLGHPAIPDIMVSSSGTPSSSFFSSSSFSSSSSSFPKGGRVWKDVTSVETSTIQIDKVTNDTNVESNHEEYSHLLPKNTISTPIDKDTIEVQVTIQPEFHMKRFKWCCRQDTFELCKYITSRKHLDDIVKGGCILLNEQVVYDNGRILKEGDVITLLKSYTDRSRMTSHQQQQQQQSTTAPKGPNQIETHSFHTVRIVMELPCQHSKWIIAFKPVGCRSSGTFSTTTLEMIVQLMMERKQQVDSIVQCRAISLLDTGCAGLCVLSMGSKDIEKDIVREPSITYTFTALVHGLVPSDWDAPVYATISCRLRSFKRQKSIDHSNSDTHTIHNVSKIPQNLNNAIQITCNSRLNIQTGGGATVQLSTISIQSTADRGKLCNVICYTLRKLGFPVVNDRFCKRELSALPRIMRNILKDKLCIGCYDLKIQEDETNEEHNVSIDPHSRTQCSYWKDIMSPS